MLKATECRAKNNLRIKLNFLMSEHTILNSRNPWVLSYLQISPLNCKICRYILTFLSLCFAYLKVLKWKYHPLHTYLVIHKAGIVMTDRMATTKSPSPIQARLENGLMKRSVSYSGGLGLFRWIVGMLTLLSGRYKQILYWTRKDWFHSKERITQYPILRLT